MAQLAVGEHGADDDGDRHAEAERRLAGYVGHLVERLPEDVAEHAEGGRPEPAADDAVRDEAAIGQARRPDDERRQSAHESDEAADQDRLAAVTLEVRLDLLEPLLVDLHLRPVPQDEAATEATTDEEARGVAEDRRGPDDPDQHDQADLALAGDHAADDHDRLAGRDEADEGAGLEEGEDPDGEVGPRTQRLGDVADELLDVGEVRHRAGRVEDHEGNGDQRRDRQRGMAADEPHPSSPVTIVSAGAGAPAACATAARCPSNVAAARSAARRSANRPKVVGPDPEICAASAPASRNAAIGSASSGRRESAAGWRSFARPAAISSSELAASRSSGSVARRSDGPPSDGPTASDGEPSASSRRRSSSP
jgi:hypothetical protein